MVVMPPVNPIALSEAIADLAAMMRGGEELTPALIASVAEDYRITPAILERKFHERYLSGIGAELPTVSEQRDPPPKAPLKPSKLALAVKRTLIQEGEKVDDARLANITLKLRSDPHLRRRTKRNLVVQSKLADIELEEALRRLAKAERRLGKKP